MSGSGRFALALPIALAMALMACKDRRPAAEPSAAVKAGLAAMPASVDQVVGLDVARLARSPLVARAVTALLERDSALAHDLSLLLDGCKIDVGRDLRHLWLGMDRDAGDRVMLVIDGKLSESQLGGCVGPVVGAAGGRLTAERVAGRTRFHVDQPDGKPDVWFAMAGDGVVAVASHPEFLADGLGKGATLDTQGALDGLVARAGADHALWFAGAVPAEVGRGLGTASGGTLSPPRAMFGHLDLDGAIDASLNVVMASAKDAEHAVSLAKPQLDTFALVAQASGFGRLVSRIAVAAAGDTLGFTLAVPEAEVRQVVGTTIDSGQTGDQNAAPSRQEGVGSDGQGDTAAGG